jgi:hypothetical protein
VLACVESAGVGVAILDLGAGLAGAYLSPNATPIAFVNGRDAPQRQRFTLAHEFGHHRLGHGQVVDEPEAMWDYGDPDEVASNAFAAAFLMPMVATQTWAAAHVDGPVSLETVMEYAAAFGVSGKAACISLETAGVLYGRLCTRLHAEIDQGLHRYVALPDVADEVAAARERLPRFPRELRESALGDLLAGVIDVGTLAGRIGRSAAAVQSMLDATGLARLLPAMR